MVEMRTRSPGEKLESLKGEVSIVRSCEALMESWACRRELYNSVTNEFAAGFEDWGGFPNGVRGWKADSSSNAVWLVVACL